MQRILAIVLILASSLLAPSITTAQEANWHQLTPTTSPPARYDHAMVFIPDTQSILLFGGRGGGALNDTWLYDIAANDWQQLSTPTAPTPRYSMGATYDPVRQHVLIFRGQTDGGGVFNDTWAFDVTSNTWSQITTEGQPPAGRYGTSAVYDDLNDWLVVSHGFASSRFDDTFGLNLETNTWTNITPDIRPLRPCLHEAVYTEGAMVLYGGCSSPIGPCPQGDTWTYDATTGLWTELNAGGSTPDARSNPALVGDSSGILWLFGGLTDNGRSNDTWSLNPSSGQWTAHSLATNPAPRSSHDAVWDSVNNQLFMFGGRGDTGPLNDMWVFTLGA